MKTFLPALLALLLIILVACIPEQPTSPEETATPGLPECINGLEGESATVVWVVDGDTIEVERNGERETVRYLMVDAPELDASDPSDGKAAQKFNIQMVKGRKVTLLREQTDRDTYGRLLRHVLLDGKLINYELVLQGYAGTFPRSPDLACAKEFQLAMLQAARGRIGIWEGIPVMSAGENACPEGCSMMRAGCEIKGNINTSGEKIYHLPGGAGYGDVRMEPARGELWFCSVESAIAAGWRPARAE